jgi:hypothetical protein
MNHLTSRRDTKPQSRVVTDGIRTAPARGMSGVWGWAMMTSPIPGRCASSWNESTPCNLSLNRLAQGAKEGVQAGGGFPMQFGTISVSDGSPWATKACTSRWFSREVIADSVETVMQAERKSAHVIEVPGEPVHAVHEHCVPVAGEPQQFRELSPGCVSAGGLVREPDPEFGLRAGVSRSGPECSRARTRSAVQPSAPPTLIPVRLGCNSL